MAYLRNLYAALIRDGMDLDRTENAICGGAAKQTISLRCARAKYIAHKAWGHLACACLAVIVAPHHCRDTLAGKRVSTETEIRAFVALALAATIAFAFGAGMVGLAAYLIGAA